MKVCFWGTRGSIPTPGATTLKYGGNTSCVQVTTDEGHLLVFDCGSGLRELGKHLNRIGPGNPVRGHVFLSHTHWDHIQGFPFFGPAFVPGNMFDLYAAHDIDRKLEDVLAGQMEYAYFPVTLGQMQSRMRFHELREGPLRIEDVAMTVQYLNHTSLCLGYRVQAGGRSLCYCTDIEPNSRILLRTDLAKGWHASSPDEALPAIVHDEDRRYARFIRGADVLIHDAMYTEEEYASKIGWGHSSAEFATTIAMLMGVRCLVLYHHEPEHDDRDIDRMVERCRAEVARCGSPLRVVAAQEGLELEV